MLSQTMIHLIIICCCCYAVLFVVCLLLFICSGCGEDRLPGDDQGFGGWRGKGDSEGEELGGVSPPVQPGAGGGPGLTCLRHEAGQQVRRQNKSRDVGVCVSSSSNSDCGE